MDKVVLYHSTREIRKAHDSDIGYDLYSEEPDFVLKPGERKLVDTGLKLYLPDNVAANVVPRSGNAHKHGLSVVNSPGLIDPGFANYVKVNLINLGQEEVEVRNGDRIAQIYMVMTFSNVVVTSNEKDIEDNRERGLNGHGSTGK